ncbi:hypothetical protein ACHAO8_011554 [Botrytis cinerea]
MFAVTLVALDDEGLLQTQRLNKSIYFGCKVQSRKMDFNDNTDTIQLISDQTRFPNDTVVDSHSTATNISMQDLIVERIVESDLVEDYQRCMRMAIGLVLFANYQLSKVRPKTRVPSWQDMNQEKCLLFYVHPEAGKHIALPYLREGLDVHDVS